MTPVIYYGGATVGQLPNCLSTSDSHWAVGVVDHTDWGFTAGGYTSPATSAGAAGTGFWGAAEPDGGFDGYDNKYVAYYPPRSGSVVPRFRSFTTRYDTWRGIFNIFNDGSGRLAKDNATDPHIEQISTQFSYRDTYIVNRHYETLDAWFVQGLKLHLDGQYCPSYRPPKYKPGITYTWYDLRCGPNATLVGNDYSLGVNGEMLGPEFGGGQDYATGGSTGLSDGSKSFFVSMWITPRTNNSGSSGSAASIFDYGDFASAGDSIRIGQIGTSFAAGDPTSGYTTFGAVNTGQPTCLTFFYDSNSATVSLFQDTNVTPVTYNKNLAITTSTNSNYTIANGFPGVVHVLSQCNDTVPAASAAHIAYYNYFCARYGLNQI